MFQIQHLHGGRMAELIKAGYSKTDMMLMLTAVTLVAGDALSKSVVGCAERPVMSVKPSALSSSYVRPVAYYPYYPSSLLSAGAVGEYETVAV